MKNKTMKNIISLFALASVVLSFSACSNYLQEFEDEYGNVSYGIQGNFGNVSLSSSSDGSSFVPGENKSNADIEDNGGSENGKSSLSSSSSFEENFSGNQDSNDKNNNNEDPNGEKSLSSEALCPKDDGWVLLYDADDKSESIMEKDSSAYNGILFQFKNKSFTYDITQMERVCVDYKASNKFDLGFGTYDSESDYYFFTSELENDKTYKSIDFEYKKMEVKYSGGNKDLNKDKVASKVSAVKAFKNAEIRRISVYSGSSTNNSCSENGIDLDKATSEYVSKCFDSNIKNSSSGTEIFNATESVDKLKNGSEWGSISDVDLTFENKLMKAVFEKTSGLVYFYVNEDKSNNGPRDVTEWGGLCIDYVSSENIYLYAHFSDDKYQKESSVSYEVGVFNATTEPTESCLSWSESPSPKLKKITDFRFVFQNTKGNAVMYIRKVFTQEKTNLVLYDAAKNYTIEGETAWTENTSAGKFVMQFFDIPKLKLSPSPFGSIFVEYNKGDLVKIFIRDDEGEYEKVYENSLEKVTEKISDVTKVGSSASVKISSLKNPIFTGFGFQCKLNAKTCDDFEVKNISLIPISWLTKPAQ